MPWGNLDVWSHISFFSFLDSQGFKKPFHSRLGKGEIGHLPRAKLSSAFPNTNATTEWNASQVAQNQAMLLDTHKYLLYTSIYKAHVMDMLKDKKILLQNTQKKTRSLLFALLSVYCA